MNPKSIRWLIIAVALAILAPRAMRAADPAPEDAALAAKLVKAVAANDYEAFVADGEAAFRQLRREQFTAVSGQLAPVLAAGYELHFLGDLRQQGYRVTLWKLSLKNGGDDLLATLAVKNGKVGGFYIH